MYQTTESKGYRRVCDRVDNQIAFFFDPEERLMASTAAEDVADIVETYQRLNDPDFDACLNQTHSECI